MEQHEPEETRGRSTWVRLVGTGVLTGLALTGAGALAAGADRSTTAPSAPDRPPVPAAARQLAAQPVAVTPPEVTPPEVTPPEVTPTVVEAPGPEDDGLAPLRRVFWDAGYGWGDALALAELWGTDELAAKADAGQRLSEGIALPFAPGTHPDPVDPGLAEADDADRFVAAGYDYDDAVALADLWRLADPYEAKVAGGQALRDGRPLPFAP